MTEKTFGEYVRDIRLSKELTLREAYRLTQILPSRLSQIENHLATNLLVSEINVIWEKIVYENDNDELRHFLKLAFDYSVNESALKDLKEIMKAIGKGATPAEMAACFGVLICKATNEEVEDFRDLLEAERDNHA